MTRNGNGWAALTLVPLLGACGAADAGWQGTVRDSAGVAIVSNAGVGAWAPADAWTVEETLRIGTAEGAAETMFGQIVGVDVDAQGRIHVMDQQAQQVRVFDAEGRHIRSFGRSGSGPGELSPQAGPVFVGPDGTIVVPDLMNQRINLYSSEGEPTGSTAHTMTDGIPTRWVKAANHDLVSQSMVIAFPGMDVEPRNLILRRDPLGAVRDTLLILPPGETVDFSGGQPRMKFFSPEPMWTYDPGDRLIYGNNAEYRLLVQGPDGALERIIEMQTERRPVTAADQTTFRRMMRDMWDHAGVPPQTVEMLIQSVSFADFYPAYANLATGPEGTLWAQSIQTPDSVEKSGASFDMHDIGGPTWDVFDAEGRYLGVVRLPARFTPLRFVDDRVYGVIRDDMDVQYVARIRVRRPGVEAR
jgi:hypothetical protein